MRNKSKEMRAIMIIVLVSNLLFACSKDGSAIEVDDTLLSNTSTPMLSSNADGTGIPSHISDSCMSGEVQVVFDADVISEYIENASIIELTFSESSLNVTAEELILSVYPDAIQTSAGPYEYQWLYTSDEDEITGLYATNSGIINYYDSSRDINGRSEDEEHIFEYGYFTEVVPLDMTVSAEEVAAEAEVFLEQYTPFDYRAYNVLASNDYDCNEGYYEINLEALVDGIPICPRAGGDEFYFPINPKINISSEGMFECQGRVCFDILNRTQLESYVSFADVLNSFINDIGILATGDTVFVDRIYLSYIPIDSEEEQLTVLVPVWCFECVDSRSENGQSINLSLTNAYSIESGSFIGEYY